MLTPVINRSHRKAVKEYPTMHNCWDCIAVIPSHWEFLVGKPCSTASTVASLWLVWVLKLFWVVVVSEASFQTLYRSTNFPQKVWALKLQYGRCWPLILMPGGYDRVLVVNFVMLFSNRHREKRRKRLRDMPETRNSWQYCRLRWLH